MKIVIIGNYGAHNVGDELIMKGIIDFLRVTLKSTEISVFSANPEISRQIHHNQGVEFISRIPCGLRSFFSSFWAQKNTFQKIKKSELIIFGGGGLFSNLSFKAYLIWLIQIMPAMILRKKFMIFSQSVGPFSNSLQEFIVKFIFRRAKLISVRDRSSAENIRKLDIHKHIFRIPDPVFQLRFSEKFPEPKNKKIIFALRNHPSTFQKIEILARFIKWLLDDQKYSVNFLSFQDRTESDNEIYRAIDKFYPIRNFIIPFSEDIGEINKLYQESTLIIGSRLHAIFLAMVQEKPFISLAYAPKVTDYLKNTRFNKQNIELTAINLPKLQNIFQKTVENHQKLSAEISQYVMKSKAELRKFEVIFKSVLKLS